MHLERLLQINMATMAALATMLLGMGQRDPTAPMLVLVAAITSVWLTDFAGWFCLNRTVANLAAVAAVVVALRDLSGLQDMSQILFIARLLVYLQIILLFQKKDNRAYWQLAMVSLLQVVVASAFNQGVWFGAMMIVYLAVGLSGLALFFLHRERLRYEPQQLDPERPVPAGPRWPLSVQPSVFLGAATSVRGSLGRELLARLGAMGLATLMLTVLLFFTVPRIGSSAWRGAAVAYRHAVGFSDEVQLGELGQIIEKPEEVMRLWLTNDDGTPYPAYGSIYLRGALLYDYHGGRWRFAQWDFRPHVRPLEITNLISTEGLVDQKITIEPMDRQELFCVWPFAKTELGGDVLFDPRRGRLMRPANECGQRFSYELKTSAFEDGAQSPFVPADDLVNVYPMLQLPATDGQSDVPGLAAQAERWIQASGLPEEDRVGRARYLERQLRDSGRFQYSLKGQQRDLNVDPIEDFVTNHPQGHCEYFATALSLMLRSQDIPSRLVVGYRTEEFNRVGRFYQVRQWHAHAWVEIYLGPQHLPEELFRGEEHWEWAAGGWLRLDPTPGGTAGQAEAGESWIDKAERSLTWFQSLWGNYVMEMDRSRQREAIYQPAADWIKGVAERLSDPRWWRDTLVGLVRGAWQFLLDWIGGDWLSWRGLVALAILGAVVLVIGRLVLVLFRWLLRRMKGETDEKVRAALARVVFYRRMETALARRGLVRSATQTQYEFAKEAGAALAQSTGRAETAQLPVRVAEAFYRVRFGEATLDKQQTEEVEQALVELERKDDGVSG